MVNKRKAVRIGKRLGVDFDRIPAEQFRRGIGVEATEHRDVVRDNPLIAGRLAHAHLRKDPDYYAMLAKMEKNINKKSPF